MRLPNRYTVAYILVDGSRASFTVYAFNKSDAAAAGAVEFAARVPEARRAGAWCWGVERG